MENSKKLNDLFKEAFEAKLHACDGGNHGDEVYI